MSKKSLALAYELNNEFVEDFINQVKKYNDEIHVDKYLIFYSCLSNKNLRKISESCSCTFIKVTRIIKSKFEIFKYLKEFETIIYTNINVILTKDFIEKYKVYDFSTISLKKQFVEYNFKKIITKYNMFDFGHDYSLIIINDKLKNYSKISKWCIRKSLMYYFVMCDRIDATLDLMIQHFKIDINPIIEKNNNINKLTYEYKMPQHFKRVNGPLVSIIMSIYDREKYYKEAINSILNQTYLNIELIIVLEYSNVQEKIYKNLLKINDNRIKIIKNKKKLGFAESLNVAIKNAKGKYIARMDDDDISIDNRIEKQVNYLEKNKEVGILGTYMQFFGQSNLVCKLATDYEDLRLLCLFKTPLFHPTVIFNLNVIKKDDLVYNKGIFTEDYELWSRLIKKYVVENLPEVLYYYRLNGENNSTSDDKKMNESHLNIMRYQMKENLKLDLSFDDLQILNGRIDVIGFSKNKEYVFKRKVKLLNIIKAKNYYNAESMEKIITEFEKYYQQIKLK